MNIVTMFPSPTLTPGIAHIGGRNDSTAESTAAMHINSAQSATFLTLSAFTRMHLRRILLCGTAAPRLLRCTGAFGPRPRPHFAGGPHGGRPGRQEPAGRGLPAGSPAVPRAGKSGAVSLFPPTKTPAPLPGSAVLPKEKGRFIFRSAQRMRVSVRRMQLWTTRAGGRCVVQVSLRVSSW